MKIEIVMQTTLEKKLGKEFLYDGNLDDVRGFAIVKIDTMYIKIDRLYRDK